MLNNIDIIIIGASASGLMCAIEAGKRGRKVLVLDHANKIGKKILMSGGGRCNFTNYYVSHVNYISHNPHFCKSALSRYTPYDFISLIEEHNIPYHEKKLGQLFCDNKAKDIVNMLLAECEKFDIKIQLNTSIKKITHKKITQDQTNKNQINKNQINKNNNQYLIESEHNNIKSSINCESLVIATGGLSIPTMGASPFGYKIAEQFGIKVWPTSAGLVPFTLQKHDLKNFEDLPGVSADSIITSESKTQFRENILFTHRGLSGPAVLQISSYWKPKEEISIDILPDINLADFFKNLLSNPENININLKQALTKLLPKRLIASLFSNKFSNDFKSDLLNLKIKNLDKNTLEILKNKLHKFNIKPNGTEGYRTAEVTLGGVDCNAISSKTMESNKHKGLYFIGEVLDVTGWLGGYNFQWAWASGWCAGQEV